MSFEIKSKEDGVFTCNREEFLSRFGAKAQMVWPHELDHADGVIYWGPGPHQGVGYWVEGGKYHYYYTRYTICNISYQDLLAKVGRFAKRHLAEV